MPKQTSHANAVRQWLQSLGVLSAVSISRAEAEMKLAAYVPRLIERFPAGAFTGASLEYVAAECTRGFPTYGELVQHLAAWWHENRPPLPRIAAQPTLEPERPPPTQEEIEQVHAKVQEIMRALAPTRYADQTYRPAQPRYLTPAQLDQLNPLPNGRKRTDAAQATVSVSEAGIAAAFDSATAEGMATADTEAGDAAPGAP